MGPSTAGLGGKGHRARHPDRTNRAADPWRGAPAGQALRELNIQQGQIEQATETLDFLRDKFTNHAFYLFLQKQTADLYRMDVRACLRRAREAERAFNFERGHTAAQSLPPPLGQPARRVAGG